jgi:hypothetical protein
MNQVTAQISISLDGFVAGPNQGKEHPLGEGGERLHEWVVPTESWRSLHGMEGGEKGPDARADRRGCLAGGDAREVPSGAHLAE